jgi:hypothetical protein
MEGIGVMGKYTQALKGLDRLPLPGAEGGDFRSKVFDAKSATPQATTLLKLRQTLELLATGFEEYPSFQTASGCPPGTRDLIDVYVAARRAKDAADEVTSLLEVVKTACEEMLAERFEVEELDTIKTEAGVTIRHQPEPYAQVTNPDELREWFKVEGMERSLNPAWGTVNALAKERLLAGEATPPGVELYVKNTHFVVSGLRKKGE